MQHASSQVLPHLLSVLQVLVFMVTGFFFSIMNRLSQLVSCKNRSGWIHGTTSDIIQGIGSRLHLCWDKAWNQGMHSDGSLQYMLSEVDILLPLAAMVVAHELTLIYPSMVCEIAC